MILGTVLNNTVSNDNRFHLKLRLVCKPVRVLLIWFLFFLYIFFSIKIVVVMVALDHRAPNCIPRQCLFGGVCFLHRKISYNIFIVLLNRCRVFFSPVVVSLSFSANVPVLNSSLSNGMPTICCLLRFCR